MKKRPTRLSHSNTRSTENAQTSASNPNFQFRVPEIPSRLQPRATSNSHGSGLDSDCEVLMPSSQPIFDHVEWQGSQTPSLRKVMEDAKSLKRRAIKTRSYHEPLTTGPLSTDVAKNSELPRMRPPLADYGKGRNQNDYDDRRASTFESVPRSSSTADDYFEKIQGMMDKFSKDMDRGNVTLSKGRRVALGKANFRGKSKAERRTTWGGGVSGRVEKQRRGGHGISILAGAEGDRRVSAKGKERESTGDICPDGRMDVDGNQSGIAMDVDLRLSPPPPLPLPWNKKCGEPLPLMSRQPAFERFEMPPPRGKTSIASTSNHLPSASSRSSTSSRLARERDIRRALSSSLPSLSGAPPTAYPSSTSLPSTSTSFSFEKSSRDLGSSRSNFDSVYGSLVMPAKDQERDKKDKEVVPSPSPSLFIPGLDYAKTEREKERTDERASVHERPYSQEVKPRSGPPVLGMTRRYNLSANATNKSFKAPFKRADSAKSLETRGLEQPESDHGPDIHEGEADSSSYSALDISMNSDLADELNNIEKKYSQDSME